MKGFKSFADNTVLEFEQGVTAVVGPNGSGKSNVVDAVTWVLGAQSTRALRSGTMSDVIFVGTSTRAALGRAEVSLTLDNASGKLPIDGAEVTISRTLFRNGDSEYAINGTTCRLLDIQELLGDSGVGRQQHMIIGQGQLDSVLNSSSENRRSIIEEAAGVLKHRRRKERAERRLAATQENLERLGDLVREVRRQMRPLERQAIAARSYADVEADLREARRHLFSSRLHVFENRQRTLDTQLRAASTKERELRHQLLNLDAQATTAAAEIASRKEEHLASTLGTLQGLSERVRGTRQLIDERGRSLQSALLASADENVIATLEADSAKLSAELTQLGIDERGLSELRSELEAASISFDAANEQYEVTWGNLSGASAQSELETALEQRALLERSGASLHASLRRVNERLAELDEKLITTKSLYEEAVAQQANSTAALDDAGRALAAAEANVKEAEAGRVAADEYLREVTDTSARSQARAEALARALEEFSGASGKAIIGKVTGVLGSFLELIEVDEGFERAVESAAGASVSAVVVDGRKSAHAALQALRNEGGSGLVLPATDVARSAASVPSNCTALRSVVRPRKDAPKDVAKVLDTMFASAVIAPNWEAGIEVAMAQPELVVVTKDGDRFAASGWRVASGRSLVTKSTVDEAGAQAEVAEAQLAPARLRRDEADARVSDARSQLSTAATQLVKVQGDIQHAFEEIERLGELRTQLEFQIHDARAELESLNEEDSVVSADLLTIDERLPELRAAVEASEERATWANEARTTVEAHREHVSSLALTLSRREAEFGERRRLIEQRRGEIEARLEGRASEREEATVRRERLEFELRTLERLAVIVDNAGEDVRLSQEALASTYREQLEVSRAGVERLEELQRERNTTEARLVELSEAVRADEIEHAELVVRINNLYESIRRDLAIEPEELGDSTTYELPDDVTIEQRVSELEDRMNSLGLINPLALEELSVLEERYKDLDAQVSDVRNARRELQEVLRALDDEIMTLFSAAVADVNEHFSTLIAMLFPGGQGRLLLTEPDDPLNTGVEIEVRPMGRNIRRVSLLSGGERSMAALAFLFAVFRSRPSPFYMMDEVEAALDDVNLQRFLGLVDEFRHEAQLLIVTHQKRTMEAADSLYGVTMAPGGSSRVVSQRVRATSELETA